MKFNRWAAAEDGLRNTNLRSTKAVKHFMKYLQKQYFLK